MGDVPISRGQMTRIFYVIAFLCLCVSLAVYAHDWLWVERWQVEAVKNFSGGLVEYPGDWIETATTTVAWDVWLSRASTTITLLLGLSSLAGGIGARNG